VIPANENGLVTVREAEQMLRCCKTTIFTLVAANKLERVKVGRATRITVRSIRAITSGL
jgi:excisionase family DNA binding protein